ncbi:hypothetical protein EDD85DRAFT_833248 [Armillaria nabsnona]|nr:hypothetical protein EDD85DRAFT_833248 [Armillaria nabsnona]
MPSCTSHASKQTHSLISITLFLTTPVSRVLSQLTIVKSHGLRDVFNTALGLEVSIRLHHFPSCCSIHGFPNSRPLRLAVAIPAGQTRLNVNKPWYRVVIHQITVAAEVRFEGACSLEQRYPHEGVRELCSDVVGYSQSTSYLLMLASKDAARRFVRMLFSSMAHIVVFLSTIVPIPSKGHRGRR